jgi:hypothetical protein
MAMTAGLASATATAALADAQSSEPRKQGAPELQQSLKQMQTPDVQRLKTINGDRDQGDEHASPRAKEVVCSKSTPASQRSAICDQSPN